MCIVRHVKYRLFLLDFKGNSIFPKNFRKKKILTLMKIPQVAAELFHMDRRT